MNEASIKQEIWQTITDMNRLWTEDGKPEELVNYFHKDMVAIAPTVRDRLFGREACVAGWKSFCDVAQTHSWETLNPVIQVYGNGEFAVVSYDFAMDFTMGGQHVHMNGRDLYALVMENGRWWVVSDQFSPRPI
jgi:hypothetical protein